MKNRDIVGNKSTSYIPIQGYGDEKEREELRETAIAMDLNPDVDGLRYSEGLYWLTLGSLTRDEALHIYALIRKILVEAKVE